MSQPVASSLHHRIIAFSLLITLISLGVILRVASMGEPIWLDEMHTLWCVSNSFSDVAPRAMIGNQSPLFFWLQYFADQGGDATPITHRIIPLVVSVLLLFSVPLVVFRLSGSLISAVVAVGLLAIDRESIFYAVEARPYGAVQLTAVWQFYYFVNSFLLLPGRNRIGSKHAAVGLAIATMLMFYLHYTTILILASECVLVLVFALGRQLTHIQRPLICIWGSVVVVAMMIPGLWQLSLISQRGSDWASIISVQGYVLSASGFAIAAIGIATVSLVAGRIRSASIVAFDWPLLALLIIGFSPMLVAVLGTLTGQLPLASYRYTIASSTILFLLAGYLVGKLKKPVSRGMVAMTTLMLFAVSSPYVQQAWSSAAIPVQRHEKDWMTLSTWLNENKHGDWSTIILFPNLVEDTRWHEIINGRADAEFENGQTASNQSLREYYQFALWPIKNDFDVVPQTVFAWPGLPQNILAGLKDGCQVMLVIRGWPEDIANIIARIQQQLPGVVIESRYDDSTDRPPFLYSIRVDDSGPR